LALHLVVESADAVNFDPFHLNGFCFPDDLRIALDIDDIAVVVMAWLIVTMSAGPLYSADLIGPPVL